MTTLTEAGTRTSADLLYLRVDLGEEPDLEVYAQATLGLVRLARYATFLTVASPQERLPPSSIRVVRTSIASPWVTVLADLAKTSTPVAYGGAALYGLHRMLQIVMTWQQHRLEIAERELQLENLRAKLVEESVQRKAAVHAEASGFRVASIDPVTWGAENAEPLQQALRGAQDLGQVEEVAMISQDDPRAAGSSAGS